MIVDIEKKETESGWFDLEGGGRVNVRLLSADDVREMRKLCETVTSEYPLLLVDPNDETKGREYRRFDVPRFDGDLWEAELSDRSILGWEAILDRNKKPVPVTREYKALLMQIAPKFREAVEAARKVLKERDAEKAEAAEKN